MTEKNENETTEIKSSTGFVPTPGVAKQPWIIDAHCHLDDEVYDEQREDILARLESEGVEAVINPGCDEASSLKAVALAKQYERLFACIGTHPHEAAGYTPEWEQRMRTLAKEKKVVAIGEIGLDYHYDFSPRKTQQVVFERQLALAQELRLPVVIHSREAREDTFAILKNFGSSLRALMHSYNEEPQAWEELAHFGYFLSLGGMVTFKNAHAPKELAKRVARDRLLLETDGPYLAPVPHRGRLNLPWYAHGTLDAIAALREESVVDLAKSIRKNTIAFFALPIEEKENESGSFSLKGKDDTFLSSEQKGQGASCAFKK